MNTWRAYFSTIKSSKTEAGLWRTIKTLDSNIDFVSNDYLGFAHRTDDHVNSGSTGSRLISGDHLEFSITEKYLSEIHQAESALLFNSGYQANLGFFSSVGSREDTILYDEFIHASIRDGIRLSKCKSWSFKHNDIDDLQQKISRSSGKLIIAVESVYSMDGDMAPLDHLYTICNSSDALLFIDEAHALGVFGSKGLGLANPKACLEIELVRMIGFGKSLGHFGAGILGSQGLIEHLVNHARSFIYSTAIPPKDAAKIRDLHIEMTKAEVERKRLYTNIDFLNSLLSPISKAKRVSDSSPIQAFICSGNARVIEFSELFASNGIQAIPIRKPTVPEGKERIRFCIHSYNTKKEISRLAELINTFYAQ